jgi:hypothetical protein
MLVMQKLMKYILQSTTLTEKGYTGPHDIKGGQINYYIRDSLGNVYATPNFTTPSIVYPTVYYDPMDVAKPLYTRESCVPYTWKYNGANVACDSFTHDSLQFREDLMEKQMRKMNRNSWEARYGAYFA